MASKIAPRRPRTPQRAPQDPPDPSPNPPKCAPRGSKIAPRALKFAPRPPRRIVCIPKETPRVPEQLQIPSCTTSLKLSGTTCTRNIPCAGAAVFRPQGVLDPPPPAQQRAACCRSHSGTFLISILQMQILQLLAQQVTREAAPARSDRTSPG